LARALEMSERELATDAVSYSFPLKRWCPVKCAEGGAFGSLYWNHGEQVLLRTEEEERNIAGGAFLRGRVSVDVRPLCMFDRPGVGVRLTEEQLGLVVRYDHEREHGYEILQADGTLARMDPDATEERVLPLVCLCFLFASADVFCF
jgi:hypothetical protein